MRHSVDLFRRHRSHAGVLRPGVGQQARLAQLVLSAPKAPDREGPGVGADADADPATVGGRGT